MSLYAMQCAMRHWLTTGDGERSPALPGNSQPGLRVYLNNYRAQLVGCLESSFPITRKWVGEEVFHTAAIAHVERMPPSSWTLDAYARDFPATLDILFPDDPEVTDLASLELALAEAFVGPDAHRIDATELHAVDWDRVEFRFVPTLDILPLRTNAAAIWSSLLCEERPCEAMRLLQESWLLVWRDAMVSRFRTIDPEERLLLLQARSGAPFSDICAVATAHHGVEEGVARAGALLGGWLRDGLISGIANS